MNDPDAAAPGDYKFDPLGIGGGTNMDLQEKEISNGRLVRPRLRTEWLVWVDRSSPRHRDVFHVPCVRRPFPHRQ